MKSIILLVGLPGSGKTFMGMMLPGIFVDDPRVSSIFNNIDSETSENIIIADPYLCLEKSRKSAEEFLKKRFPNHKIEYICFTNDPIQCKINVKNRSDNRKVDGLIDMLTLQYKPFGNIIDVYRKEGNE